MTYSRVAQGASPSRHGRRPSDAGVDTFLIGHVNSLQQRATSGDAPLARFVDDEARNLFEALRSAGDKDFYDAAHKLALRLVSQMDGRSAPGLLLCVRVSDEDSAVGVALKLEVVTPNSAVLERLESGEEVLASVKNVLDAPGDLQKGALVEDRRPGGEVIIGDRLSKDAQYFPRAFGISVDQKPLDGAVDLVAVISSVVPSATDGVIAALPEIESGTVEHLLEAIAAREPALTAEARASVSSALEERRRPVRRVDTSTALKKVLKAQGITVSGLASVMNRLVSVSRRTEGGWRITVDIEEEPSTSYTR